MSAKYRKIDLSTVDRKKIRKDHGIDACEKIRTYDDPKELYAYPCAGERREEQRCYWDHHVFEGPGCCCPISYIPRQISATTDSFRPHVSEVPRSGIDSSSHGARPTTEDRADEEDAINRPSSDKVFVIKENIPFSKDVSSLDVSDSYYEVDGLFCSPECCLAFINDEKTKAGGSKYADSERYLYNMLGLTTKCQPANSYRLLKEYGGNLSIQQFRNNNKSIKYEFNGTTVLISHLFEKKINLNLSTV